MTDTRLKPCPFCGSDRVTVWNIRDGQQAICKDCKALGAPTYHGPGRADNPMDTWERAVAAWNTRTPAPEAGAGKATIAAILDKELSGGQNRLELLKAADAIMGLALFSGDWRQGIEQAAELAENFTSANHVAQDIKDGIFPEQSPIREAMARAIRGIEAPGTQPATEQQSVKEAAREEVVDEIEEIIGETHDIDVTDRCYAENIVSWMERHHPAALRSIAQGDE